MYHSDWAHCQRGGVMCLGMCSCSGACAGDLEQKLLYDALYGVVDDAQMILHSLLTLKEAFSWGVCRHTLSGILGIECGVNPV